MLQKLAAWASILSFGTLLAERAWALLMIDRVQFLELALLTIGVITGGIYLREKVKKVMQEWRDFKEWVQYYPSTDQAGSGDNNLYMRINRLIDAKLKTYRPPGPPHATP